MRAEAVTVLPRRAAATRETEELMVAAKAPGGSLEASRR